MPLTPGHYQQAQTRMLRSRTGRDRWFMWVGGLVTITVVALVIFALTSHAPKNGHGCTSFTYPRATGGEEFYAAGAKARHTGAKPPQLGGLANGFAGRLRDACREAGIPYDTAVTPAS